MTSNKSDHFADAGKVITVTPAMIEAERYENLILDSGNTIAENAESDLFMRGFAYGRFTTLHSELALHWGVLRNHAVHDCPLVTNLDNLAAPPEVASYEPDGSDAPIRGEVASETDVLAERMTAWLYEREGGVAFDDLPYDDQLRWAEQGRAAIAAVRPKVASEADVARALYEHWVSENVEDDWTGWERLGDKETWLDRARAAITAMQRSA